MPEASGVGSALARVALEYARGAGLVPVPVHPFIASYMRRHPQYPMPVRASH